MKTMQMLLTLTKKIKSAILDYWENPLPKTVFEPVKISRK